MRACSSRRRSDRAGNDSGYRTEIDAAYAYDARAREEYGAFAGLNFADVSESPYRLCGCTHLHRAVDIKELPA